MKIRFHLACLLVTFIVLSQLIAQVADHSVNRDALIGEVGSHVKMLAFNTDKPVQYSRLVIDGKEVASDIRCQGVKGNGAAFRSMNAAAAGEFRCWRYGETMKLESA